MTEAIRWYTAAAEGGNADAMHDLGWHYDHGEGVEQDMKKAICWYERAAEQNHPAAMNSLGECYAMGRGVPRDLETPWNGIAARRAGRSHGGLQHGMAFGAGREAV